MGKERKTFQPQLPGWEDAKTVQLRLPGKIGETPQKVILTIPDGRDPNWPRRVIKLADTLNQQKREE